MLELEALFARGLEVCVGAPPIVLEIGFGRAELIMDLAEQHPEQAFLGVEVSRKRVAKAGARVERRGLANLRLVHAPAEYLLERVLPSACVAECWINCPDPWPKKRHFKRRLLRATVLAQLARVLVPGALLHVCTDHEGYRDWIAHALAGEARLENLHAPRAWSKEPPERRETAYEAEWRAEGRSLAYFDYRRSA